MDKFISKTQMQTILDSRPKGVSMDEVIKGFRSNGYKVEGIDETPPPEQTTLQQSKDVAVGFGKGLARTAVNTASGLQTIGQGAMMAVGVPNETVAQTGFKSLDTSTPEGQALQQSLQPTNEMQKYGGYGETGAELLAGGGAGLIKDTVVGGSKLIAKGASKAGEVISPVTEGVSTLTKDIINPLVKAPGRLKTNLAEKQIQQAEIQALPTKQARNVVNEGVDIADTRDIINLTKDSKAPELRKLFSTVEDFAAGNKKIDPAEIVGTPIVKKLKESEKLKDIVGSKLTEVSKNLGIVEKPELVNSVFARLREVPGMENLSLKGDVLDFKGTTLASQLTKSDRNTIQQAFKQSIKWGDGEKAHKFRQELFEILGGKKKSLETMTATQEESLNAIRKGLADVLDSKNGQYKALNETYAKLAQPVSEMRKLMKGLAPDDPEDILNMSAGLLARRITSAAPSNANVRMILKSLDNIVPSDTLGRVESLQDFYNILNKYYDIAPRTGFQNLTKEAIDSSMTSKVTGAIGEYVGKTDATRQKAIKEFLESVLKD